MLVCPLVSHPDAEGALTHYTQNFHPGHQSLLPLWTKSAAGNQCASHIDQRVCQCLDVTPKDIQAWRYLTLWGRRCLTCSFQRYSVWKSCRYLWKQQQYHNKYNDEGQGNDSPTHHWSKEKTHQYKACPTWLTCKYTKNKELECDTLKLLSVSNSVTHAHTHTDTIFTSPRGAAQSSCATNYWVLISSKEQKTSRSQSFQKVNVQKRGQQPTRTESKSRPKAEDGTSQLLCPAHIQTRPWPNQKDF